MGRDQRLPESADSWGEFHALIDMERDARENEVHVRHATRAKPRVQHVPGDLLRISGAQRRESLNHGRPPLCVPASPRARTRRRLISPNL
jgi:hypothetical protein